MGAGRCEKIVYPTKNKIIIIIIIIIIFWMDGIHGMIGEMGLAENDCRDRENW